MDSHPLQSTEWENFRKETGIKTLRIEGELLTLHKIPQTSFNIGYMPKGSLPDKKLIDELKKVGRKENCIFIQVEPNVVRIKNTELRIKATIHDSKFMIRPSTHPLFTRYTFILDLTKSEDDLLKNMHPKTRYNIRVAQKHGVEIVEDNSDAAFEQYLKLTKETTQRQGFFAHSEQYHRIMWQTLRVANGKSQMADRNKLAAHLFIAKYHAPSAISYMPLVAWIVFVYGDTIYYPYGASSSEHRETMASNLMMWEVIKWAKNLPAGRQGMGLKKFDMWGALSENPDEHDPWFGFHRFKQGYGPKHVEFVGSFDLVIKPFLYELYKISDKIRWSLLRIFK